MQDSQEIKRIVKEKYADIAKHAKSRAESGCSCGCSENEYSDISENYSRLSGYQADADLGLGCGVPTEHANMKQGDTVLDLGSGAGNDAFVARSIVGETGRVIGVDMTEEMIEKANRNLAKLGYRNVEFRFGEIEDLPVANGEIDVIISNCVLNLVPSKEKAFSEIYRALKPGGHFCVSDIVLVGALPEPVRKSAEMYAGCVSGALQKEEYLRIIRATGFAGILVKKERKIELDRALLSAYLSEAEVDRFLSSDFGIYSVTVYAKKPEVV